MKKEHKKIYLVIAVICLLIAVAAVVCLVKYFLNIQKAERDNEALQEQIEVTRESSVSEQPEETIEASTEAAEESSEAATEPSETAASEEEEAMLRRIDFAKMQEETNEDIYSWIYIPGTVIDYPVLQHPTDDSYYLNYNIDGTKGRPGCIYTEKLNAKDYTDFNTVLYGHDMRAGTMFHDLHKYEDASFLEEQPYVYIYLPDKTLKYQIFAAYTYDDRHLMYSFDFNSEKVQEGYLQDVFSMRDLSAVIDDTVEVTAEDSIITLSTCVYGQDTSRFLVQAVLLEEGINE